MRQSNYEIARIKMLEGRNKPLNNEFIILIHNLVVGTGKHGYRNGPGAPRVAGIYLSPDSLLYDISNEMQKFLDWYSNNSTKFSIVEKVAWIHWGIVKIHPFYDGNGRTARIFMSYILLKNGYNDSKGKSLEKHCEVNRQAYGKALCDVESCYNGFNKMNPIWLEFIKNACENVLGYN